MRSASRGSPIDSLDCSGPYQTTAHMSSNLTSQPAPMGGGLPDMIIVAGAPGTGKTTVCQILAEPLAAPYLDLGQLRSLHLDSDWQRMSAADEAVGFENLVAMVRNYCSHGFR